MQAAGVEFGRRAVLGTVGIGALAPVGQRPGEVPVAQLRRLVHQHRLVVLETVSADWRARLGQRRDVVGVDLTRQPGRLGMGHVPQRPPQPQAPPCRRQRRADARREPRRRAAGTVGLPGAARLEGGRGPGGGRIQPLELAMQVLDGLAVGEPRRLCLTHRVDRFGELSEDVHRSSASGPCRGPSRFTPTVD